MKRCAVIAMGAGDMADNGSNKHAGKCIKLSDIQTQPGSNLLEMWNNTVDYYNSIVDMLA